MDSRLSYYATMLIKAGVNLQPSQPLVINADVAMADFVHLIVDEAYLADASDVFVRWRDGHTSRARFQHGAEELFSAIDPWIVDQTMHFVKKGAAILSLVGDDPNLYDGIAQERLASYSKAYNLALKEYYDLMMADHLRWCVAAVPTVPWAQLLFPGLSPEQSLQHTWDAILAALDVTDDRSWQRALEKYEFLAHKAKELTALRLTHLHMTTGAGTDVMIGLPQHHVWAGGSGIAQDGITFCANLPTEEVFTAPDKNHVDGVVYSTKPLFHMGQKIDGIYLKFSQGVVVDYDAQVGKEALKTLLETDNGAKRLGEVALVPFDSPISNTNKIFMETLFDENAACHLALGKAYPTSIAGGDTMDATTLANSGMNDSMIHVDFMIGDSATNIIGYDEKGEEHTIFCHGNWA